MPYVRVGEENSGKIELYYEDHGTGKPIVLIHGWPLSSRSWEKQLVALLDAGYRVIMYDRRGFGDSSHPTAGYDYDTLAQDLRKVITKLNLQDVTLVGFSMGGGEVARYLGIYGSERINKAVFISAVPPFLLKTENNPSGIEGRVFDEIKRGILEDRLKFLSQFLSDFYNVDVFGGNRASEQIVKFSWNLASIASPKGTFDCVSAWLTDFRKDLARIDIPTLVVHGDSDRVLPITATGIRLHETIRGSKLITIQGGPHGLIWTHADQLNQALIEFLTEEKAIHAA